MSYSTYYNERINELVQVSKAIQSRTGLSNELSVKAALELMKIDEIKETKEAIEKLERNVVNQLDTLKDYVEIIANESVAYKIGTVKDELEKIREVIQDK